MNVLSFILDHSQTVYKGTKGTFKFKCVVQTRDTKIEQYLMTTWPKLMTMQQYTQQDNLDQYKMIDYIKKNLKPRDIEDVLKISFDRSWWNPIEIRHNIVKCTLTDYRAKIWSQPNVPYLELTGEITFDFTDLIKLYIKEKWMVFKTESGIFAEAPHIEFLKPMPFASIYNGSQTPSKIVLDEIIKQASQSGSEITKLLVTTTKLKSIHSYKKDIKWSMDRKKILIEIKEKIRLLKDKALASPIKYGLMGLAAHEITKNMKPSTKVGLAAALWLTQK